ncbi:hypothetical protein DNTS_025551, partial [Danionella cerebrum]
MKALLVSLMAFNLALAMGHWCDVVEEETLEKLVSPRQEQTVDCSSFYRFKTEGWRLDVERMRRQHGGDDAIAQHFHAHGPSASCYIYRPPDIEMQTVKKTARRCCEGWAGPHCTQEVGVRGQCFSTWTCEEFPGLQNSSLMDHEHCCRSLWGLSWRNASDQSCLSCSYTLLSDSSSSPVLRAGFFRAIRDPQSSPSCLSWGGAHYRTFDRKHFHFQGSCTYLLASHTDGTWSVYISTVCESNGRCRKSIRMMLGLGLISVQKGNMTVNGLDLPQGEPLFQNGVSVHWLGDFVFVESGLGVRLKFDMENTVYLTVNAEHFAATRGLYDFTTSAGLVSQYAASFGNSWRVQDQHGQMCSDAAELGHSCDLSYDVSLRRDAEATCHRLKDSPFSHCHPQVDPGPYIDTCLYLFCSLDEKERETAVCDTLASYVRECAQQHAIFSWRSNTFCARVCPNGQIFSDCVSSCPASCTSPHPPTSAQCREECVGGCECPPGLFLHSGRCLKRDECPCFHRRHSYSAGDQIRQRCNTCVCRGGRWECSAEKCEAQCTVTGAMHISTFDQKRYSLQASDCHYTAVEDFVDQKLRVILSGGECSGGDGCVREITITALHTTLTVTGSGSVIAGGQRKLLPVITGDLVVRRASSAVLMIQAFGAQLMWHLDGPLLTITLQPGFAHKVRGLCGTLTWNQHDDFTTAEGDVESSVASFAAKFRTDSCPLPSTMSSDPCGTHTHRRKYADSVCSVIHSAVFQACHDVVEREPFMRMCLSERCSALVVRYTRNVGVYAGLPVLICGNPGSVRKTWAPGCVCQAVSVQTDWLRTGRVSVYRSTCVPARMETHYTRQEAQFRGTATAVCVVSRDGTAVSLCVRVFVLPPVTPTTSHLMAVTSPSWETVREQWSLHNQCGKCAENVPCGSTGVTCTKSVTLSIGNTAVHLLRGKSVTVNGIPVSLPKSYSGSGLILERVGLFLSLFSRLGVTLLWDGGMRVYVHLMPHLRSRVGGLCGNFDGDGENDFTTRQGIIESTPELFGNSWKISPSCPDVADQDLRDPCSINPHRVTWAKKKCSVISREVFSPCHSEVPYQQYYDWCVFDACGCDSGGDCECLCTAVAAYAEECNRRGVYVRWRSQELCPLQCEKGLVYEACGPTCSPACPSAPAVSESLCSTLSCVEGCFCPPDTFRHGDGCIPLSQCPCEWDGSLFPAGTSVTQHCQN